MRYIIAFCILLSGCADNRKHILEIEPQYKKYVTLFEDESRNFGNPIKINHLIIKTVSKLDDYVLANCVQLYALPPTINISLQYWRYLSETEREMLLFHEMGHCILDRRHNDNIENGVYKSLMATYIFGPDVYLLYRSQYLSELFQK